MKAATVAAASSNSRQQWVPLLQQAAQEVFELMLASKLVVGEPAAELRLDITAMVGLAGQLCGIMTVRCTTKSAQRMASKMLGIEAEQAGQEMWDAVGEICNMVAGNFKNKVSGLGDGCMLSVPTVITGADYDLHSLAEDCALRTTLLFEDEYLIVALQIQSEA